MVESRGGQQSGQQITLALCDIGAMQPERSRADRRMIGIKGLAALAQLITVFTVMALVGFMLNYLRRIHPRTWEALGQPTLPSLSKTRPSMENARALLAFWGFVLFSNQYRALDDPQLVKLVWMIRVFFALGLLLGPILRYVPR
jgi:hypothetical protein